MRIQMMAAIGLVVAQLAAASPETVEIKLKHNSAAESLVWQQLERLLQESEGVRVDIVNSRGIS